MLSSVAADLRVPGAPGLCRLRRPAGRGAGRYGTVCHGSVSRVLEVEDTADTAVAHGVSVRSINAAARNLVWVQCRLGRSFAPAGARGVGYACNPRLAPWAIHLPPLPGLRGSACELLVCIARACLGADALLHFHVT